MNSLENVVCDRLEWIDQCEAAKRLGVSTRWLQELEDHAPPRLPGGKGEVAAYLWPTLAVWYEEVKDLKNRGKDHQATGRILDSWERFRGDLATDRGCYRAQEFFSEMLKGAKVQGKLTVERAEHAALLARTGICLWIQGVPVVAGPKGVLVRFFKVRTLADLSEWWADYQKRWHLERPKGVNPSMNAMTFAHLMGLHYKTAEWIHAQEKNDSSKRSGTDRGR